MSAKIILASVGIICAVCSLIFSGVPLLAVSVVFVGVAVLVP